LSDPDSRHCRNLERSPSLAMTVFRSVQEWGGQDRGLQLFGTGARTSGRAVADAERTYAARFAPYAKWMKGMSRAERRQAALLRSYAFYRFLPDRIKILDEAEFGGAIFVTALIVRGRRIPLRDRKSTRLNSSHQIISYAVFCLKKKKQITPRHKKHTK